MKLPPLRPAALRLYRLAVVAVIVWLVRDLAVRQRTHGDSPLTAQDVEGVLPGAASLRPDDSDRNGLFVLDRAERELGYVVRTQPQCRDIIGYCGVTDVLIVLDRDWKIVGLKVHGSEDTRDHVATVVLDRKFLKKWNGLTWGAAADLDLQRAGIEGVSGATMTSMAIARSVKARLLAGRDEIVARPPLRFGWRDWGLLAVLAGAAAMAFGPPAWRHRAWWPYRLFLVAYVGCIGGDLIAQSLLVGWTRSGIPWTTAPGLVLLVAAAFLVPWMTPTPFYCHHVCPHGAVQEMIGRLRPAHFRLSLPPGAVRGLAWLPAGLLFLVLVVGMLVLPLELAGLEPFDAYHLRAAGAATIAVALAGLAVSFFVPLGYCRFGCPTGALLNFVRARGATDRFSRRDATALAFVATAALLNWYYVPIITWVKGLP